MIDSNVKQPVVSAPIVAGASLWAGVRPDSSEGSWFSFLLLLMITRVASRRSLLYLLGTYKHTSISTLAQTDGSCLDGVSEAGLFTWSKTRPKQQSESSAGVKDSLPKIC